MLGVNLPESADQQTLRYADDDALAMHQLLQDAGVESRLLVTFDEETRRLHPSLSPSGPPTLDTLRHTLREIERQIGKAKREGATSELHFFYSGHGDVEKGEGYGVLPGDRLTRTRLFDDVINRSQADRIHVIIDACKSYFLVFGKGPGGTRTPYPYPFAEEALSFDFNRVGFVLFASSGRESHEWERYQAGIFSHEVRSAFRGGADADGDGRMAYAELGARLLSLAYPRPMKVGVPAPATTNTNAVTTNVFPWEKAAVMLMGTETETGTRTRTRISTQMPMGICPEQVRARPLPTTIAYLCASPVE